MPEVAIRSLGPGTNLGFGDEGGAAQKNLRAAHLNALANAGVHQAEIQGNSGGRYGLVETYVEAVRAVAIPKDALRTNGD